MKDITERLEDCGCCDSYEAAEEIERLRAERDLLRAEAKELRGWKGDALHSYQVCAMERDRFCAERDEARRCRAETDHRMARLLAEIQCRVEHGANSNGHLDAIWNLWKEGRL